MTNDNTETKNKPSIRKTVATSKPVSSRKTTTTTTIKTRAKAVTQKNSTTTTSRKSTSRAKTKTTQTTVKRLVKPSPQTSINHGNIDSYQRGCCKVWPD